MGLYNTQNYFQKVQDSAKRSYDTVKESYGIVKSAYETFVEQTLGRLTSHLGNYGNLKGLSELIDAPLLR